MKNPRRKNLIGFSLFELFIISILVFFLLSKMFFLQLGAAKIEPIWIDLWYQCYRLEYQITRILGLNPGGIWESGLWYPFHKFSILFDEPAWGVSLLVTPIWAITKNIFSVYSLSGIFAIFLSWIFTYYFVKRLGAAKIWAFYAGAVFCLSGINLLLLCQYTFWPFFFIPLLGLVTRKIFTTPRLYWGLLWGFLFGYLAWSSAHLFVMGGTFLGLFIFWNLSFNNHSKKTLATLLVAFVLSALIAGVVLGSMYFVAEKFGFSRGYYEPYLYSSNWANLIYRHWPGFSFNPITKTHFWEYLGANAKGETNIGISFILILSALMIMFKRLKAPNPISDKKNKYSKYTLLGVIIVSTSLAFLNMYSLILKSRQFGIPLPNLAVTITCLSYAIAGSIIYLLRHKIKSAIKHIDFFFLLSAILFGLFAFGPYYLTGDGLVVASPVAFLQYLAPGFSGIQATARWGLMLSFALSIGVAIFLSQYAASRRLKFFAGIFILFSLLELTPGFRIPEFKNFSPYKWTPRETDIFLRGLPDNGAVLELASYPIVNEEEQRVVSENSLGYTIFSSLYHRKPLVTGYSSYSPHVTQRYLFDPEDKTLSRQKIDILRKFGARYWVFHIGDWSPEEIRSLKNSLSPLKQIAEIDQGKTLVYEDPEPQAYVGYYDLKGR